jgi:predicted 3-demethylubiquinone-9 3-methyltransferase (glyoxalase superfamily)
MSRGSDAGKVKRAMDAMFKMKKLDIGILRKVHN